MRLIRLVVFLALSVTLAPLTGEAQQVPRVPRVGYLFSFTPAAGRDLWEACRQGLRELVPGLVRVAVLTNPGTDDRHVAVEHAAASLGIQREVVTVARAEEIEGAFTLMKAKRVGAVVELPRSPLFFAERQRIADLAVQSRLPAACYPKEYVEAGCLLYYGASLQDVLRRSAQYVDKILKGVKPADLPVEQPTKFELVINLKTAKALGLTIPQTLLLRADKVIDQ